MSYIGSDAEQDKNISDFHRQRSTSNLISKNLESQKISNMWNDKRDDDTDSEISDSGNFLAKGAFLLTPSHELSMDRAALICEKMNFKGCFSLTKTATGILFKFSNPEDYQIVFKKGFHKVTNARFYKKIAIPCRPQKTFIVYVFDVPEDLPEEDVRHALYKFSSVVEVVRLVVHYQKQSEPSQSGELVCDNFNEYRTLSSNYEFFLNRNHDAKGPNSKKCTKVGRARHGQHKRFSAASN